MKKSFTQPGRNSSHPHHTIPMACRWQMCLPQRSFLLTSYPPKLRHEKPKIASLYFEGKGYGEGETSRFQHCTHNGIFYRHCEEQSDEATSVDGRRCCHEEIATLRSQ